MERPLLKSAIHKLALAGEQAGFSLDQMIQMLNDGISVEQLIEVIGLEIECNEPNRPPNPNSAWVM